MFWNQEVLVEMEDQLVHNKDYQPIIRFIAYSMDGELDTQEEVWRVEKKEFRAILKEKTKWTNYYVRKFIQVYVDMGVIKEVGKYYEFSKVDTSLAWTKLDIGTVIYCLKYLNDIIIKIYCLLLYRYNKYVYYNLKNPFPQPFKFSRAQVCRGIGLSDRWQDNLTKIDFALETLASLNLIDYDPGPFYEYDPELDVTTPWMILYKVNQYSDPQKNVAKTIIKEKRKINNNEDKAMIAAPIQDMSEKEIKKLQSKPSLKDHPIDYYNTRAGQSPLAYFGSETYDLVKLLYTSIKSYLQEGEIANFEVTEQLRQVCIELFDCDYCDELVGKS